MYVNYLTYLPLLPPHLYGEWILRRDTRPRVSVGKFSLRTPQERCPYIHFADPSTSLLPPTKGP